MDFERPDYNEELAHDKHRYEADFAHRLVLYVDRVESRSAYYEALTKNLEAKAEHYEAVAQKLVDENQKLKAAGREMYDHIVAAHRWVQEGEWSAALEQLDLALVDRSLFGDATQGKE